MIIEIIPIDVNVKLADRRPEDRAASSRVSKVEVLCEWDVGGQEMRQGGG